MSSEIERLVVQARSQTAIALEAIRDEREEDLRRAVYLLGEDADRLREITSSM